MCPLASHPTISANPLPCGRDGVPSPTGVPGCAIASVRAAHQQAGRTAGGAQGGKAEEHRRAWDRIGEEKRRLQGRKARIMGGAARVAEGWTEGQGMPRGGEAQAVEELQRAWADLSRRLERVERAEREGGSHRELAKKSGGSEGRPRLRPFK